MSVPSTLLAGRYRLDELIATGGMGVVWKGWDELLERPVAVKQLRTELGVTEEEAELAKHRAMREARITARLHHPHAVLVFDAVENDGQPCLIMQYLPSIPLSAVLRQRGPLPLAEVARIGAEIASALAAAHQLGIVHRDVKPGNILIAEDGRALISDFGISHALGDATLTSTGLVHGTPAFLAPEVARGGESSFASDVFSFGSTLYTALEGEPPFGMDNNSIAMLHRVAVGEVRAPEHGGLLTPLLMEMLDADPEARPGMRTAATRLRRLQARAEAEADDAAPPVAPTGVLAPAPATEPGVAALAATEALSAQDSDPDGMAQWFEDHAVTVEEVRAAAALPEEAPADPASAEEPAPEVASGTDATPTETVDTSTGTVGTGEDEATRPTLTTPLLPAAAGGAGALPARAAEPLPAAAATPVPTPEAEPAREARDPRRRRILLAVLAVLAALLLVALVVPALVRGILGPAATPTTTPSHPVAASSPAPSATTSPSASATPTTTPTTAAESSTPSASPSATAKPKPKPEKKQPKGPAAVATSPSAALTSYYGLLPGNTDAAWSRLTDHFKATTAGPRSYFDSFWGGVSSVSVSNISAEGSREAVATVTLHFKNGGTEVDRSAFWFVESGGVLKIDRQQNQ